MCYHILVSQSSTAVTQSELGEEASCVKRLQHLGQTERSLITGDPPSHNFDESQPKYRICPLKIYPLRKLSAK